MNRPTITVAIPSYNKEKYIEECIKSALLNKEYIDKIIIVDNKSTDKTVEIAKKYEPEIQVHVNAENIGMSPNFNKCIELCDTDYLMILHADDELVEGAIKIYRNYIEKYETAGIIHADSYSMIEKDKSTLSASERRMGSFYPKGNEAMNCHYGVCSSVMVKMDVYKKLGGFIESSLSSDYEMWARIANNFDLASINEPTVIYRVNSTSTGPQSLINRSPFEIKKDWNNLQEKVAESIADIDERRKYLEKCNNEKAYNYLSILKANIRARKIKNTLKSIVLILKSKNGFSALFTLINNIFKK